MLYFVYKYKCILNMFLKCFGWELTRSYSVPSTREVEVLLSSGVSGSIHPPFTDVAHRDARAREMNDIFDL
jgi:hypothetical protein